ncbi:Protein DETOXIFICATION 33 [Asimina triloba]
MTSADTLPRHPKKKKHSACAGKFSIWILPQLFAYAVNFPIQKFLQAQRKVMVMAVVSAVVLVINVVVSWLLILKLEWGLVGAALSLNLSFWLLNFGFMAYIFSGTCGEAWSGFSWLAFKDLYPFLKLSIASAVMLCLEYWYVMLLVVLTGRLKDPLIAVDAISVCVRVSNELGAGNSQAAKFSVLVVSIMSVIIGVIIVALVLVTRDQFPLLFTSSIEVAKLVSKLTSLLSISLLLNSLQPVLSGVAIGAGWQALVAYINIACYYIFGLPVGLILGFKLKFGVEGLWGGMIAGISLQTIALVIVTSCRNWKEEASQAKNRVEKWGGLAGEDESS